MLLSDPTLDLGCEPLDGRGATSSFPQALPTFLEADRSSSPTGEAVRPVFHTAMLRTKMGRGPSTSASTRAKGKRDRVLMKASRPDYHTVMLCWHWSRAAVRLVLPPSSAASDGLATYFLCRASLHGDAQYCTRTSFFADPPDHIAEPLEYSQPSSSRASNGVRHPSLQPNVSIGIPHH